MRKVLVLLIVFYVMTGVIAVAEDKNLIWESDFSSEELGKPVAGYDSKCVLKEEDGRRFLSFIKGKPPKHMAWVINSAPQNNSLIPPKDWKDYDFTFRARFPDKGVGLYAIVNKNGAKPDFRYTWYYVIISSKDVNIKCHGCPKDKIVNYDKKTYSSAGLDNIKPGEWNKFTISVLNSRKELIIKREKDGKMIEVGSFAIAPGGGGIGSLNYSSIDITDIQVKKAVESDNNK